MGIVPRERLVFVLSHFWRFTARAVGLSLLLGVCLALAAHPFMATATSPIAPVRMVSKIDAQATATAKPSSNKKSGSRPEAAKVAVTAKESPKCTKAQMLQPTALKLSGSGLVESHEAPRHYEVYGRSLAEVRKQIVRCAPGEYFAYTSSRLSWKYSFAAAPGGCVITNVGVGIRTLVHYPGWKGRQGASAADQQAWQRMANNLVLHETGHVQRSSTVAKQMYAALKGMPVTSCDAIAAKAQSIVTLYNNKLKQTHVDYDHQTNHGETQGAVL